MPSLLILNLSEALCHHRVNSLAPRQPRQAPRDPDARRPTHPNPPPPTTPAPTNHQPPEGKERKKLSRRAQLGQALAGDEGKRRNVPAPPQSPPAAALHDGGVLPEEHPRRAVERVPRQQRLERDAGSSGRKSPARSRALRRIRPSRVSGLSLGPSHVNRRAATSSPRGASG